MSTQAASTFAGPSGPTLAAHAGALQVRWSWPRAPRARLPPRRSPPTSDALTLGYTLRELLSLLAHWGHSWPLEWPRWPGFRVCQPADGWLSELRLLTDADVAASFCRIFNLPPDAGGKLKIVLDVDGPDRVLTASIQAAGASVAARYLAGGRRRTPTAGGPTRGPGVPYARPRAPPVFA